jgi:hypothetical protein
MCDTSNIPASVRTAWMLVDLRSVVDRHIPTAEVDHAGAGGAVGGVERCLFEQAPLPSQKEKGRAASSVSPVCPFT